MKRRSTTTKKKRYSKKYKGSWIRLGRGYTSLSIRKPSTLPDQLRVRLDYCQVDVISAVASPVDRIFSLNNPFAPNPVSGHQPYGWDQYSAFYKFYRVMACAIDVSIINTVATDAQFAIVPNTVITAFTDIQTAIESPRVKYSNWLSGGTGSTILAQNRIKHYVTAREIFGITTAELADLEYASSMTVGSPSRLAYWHIVYQTQSGNASYNYTIKLKYYIEFFRRAELAPS